MSKVVAGSLVLQMFLQFRCFLPLRELTIRHGRCIPPQLVRLGLVRLVCLFLHQLELLPVPRRLLRTLRQQHGGEVFVCHLPLEALRLQEAFNLAAQKPIKVCHNALA